MTLPGLFDLLTALLIGCAVVLPMIVIALLLIRWWERGE